MAEHLENSIDLFSRLRPSMRLATVLLTILRMNTKRTSRATATVHMLSNFVFIDPSFAHRACAHCSGRNKDMNKMLHPILISVWVIFDLTACEKQPGGHQSDKPVPSSPSSPNSSSDSTSEEMMRSVLSKTGFEDPSDGYFHAYALTREAEKATDPDDSIRNLQEALGYLREVKKRYPEWKIVMVDTRIRKTEESLVGILKSN